MSKQKWRCAVLALLLITVSISGCVGAEVLGLSAN